MTDNRTALVTGGAGYIGCHMVYALRDAGWDVVIVDNLSTGIRDAVPADVTFVEGEAGDTAMVVELMRRHRIDAVLHFAGSIVVPESVVDPLKYYRNNTAVSGNLLAACVEAGVDRFVFSSTAAVYGTPDTVMISEDTPTGPDSPYGTSKLMTEYMLRDTAAAHGLRYVALRYFNVAGADPAGRAGQSTPEATHLIKVACQKAIGKRDRLDIFGTDYDTADGTCVRDYIHVSDLAAAHLLALEHLAGGGESLTLNGGYGRGFSVREVLDAVAAEAGVDLGAVDGPRRAGDPVALVADSSRLRKRFGWQPRHDDLALIVRTALAWERRIAGLPAHKAEVHATSGA